MVAKSVFGYNVIVNSDDFWVQVYLSQKKSNRDLDGSDEAWLSESQACEFISIFLCFLEVPLPNLLTLKNLLLRGVFNDNTLLTDEDITVSYASTVCSYSDQTGAAYHAKLRVRREDDNTFDIEFLFPDTTIAQVFYDYLN